MTSGHSDVLTTKLTSPKKGETSPLIVPRHNLHDLMELDGYFHHGDVQNHKMMCILGAPN